MGRYRNFYRYYISLMLTVLVVGGVVFVRQMSRENAAARSKMESLQSEIAKLAQDKPASDKLSGELDELKLAISEFKAQSNDNTSVLGVLSSPSATSSDKILGYATLLSANDNSSLYEENRSSSRLVGKASFGEIYPFYKKESNWYQIKLTDGTSGWILGTFIKEVGKL